MGICEMKGFSDFIIAFCSSCIFLGFLYMLCPEGNMASGVKYVFCLCFLCCILGSVTNLKEFDFGDFSSSIKTETVNERSASVSAENVFAEALSSQNINFTKITVDTNKLSNESIIISKVTVYSDCDKEDIIAVIGSDSYEVCVINE